MNDEFKKLNLKYNDDTYLEFPFISKYKITLLSKGLYKKFKAKYRGCTAVFNKETGEFEFPLYGMFRIPEDIVIVPKTVKFNDEKSSLLHAALKAGFKQVDGPPTFEPIYFPTDSPEAKAALANKAVFYRQNHKDSKEDNNSITI